MLGFVVVGTGVGVGAGVGMTLRVGGRANRDRDDGLVGDTAALPSSEHSQALQNTCEQRIDD